MYNYIKTNNNRLVIIFGTINFIRLKIICHLSTYIIIIKISPQCIFFFITALYRWSFYITFSLNRISSNTEVVLEISQFTCSYGTHCFIVKLNLSPSAHVRSPYTDPLEHILYLQQTILNRSNFKTEFLPTSSNRSNLVLSTDVLEYRQLDKGKRHPFDCYIALRQDRREVLQHRYVVMQNH